MIYFCKLSLSEYIVHTQYSNKTLQIGKTYVNTQSKIFI